MLLFFITKTATAQQHVNNIKDSVFQIKELEQVIVSYSDFEEKKKYITQKIEVITSKTISLTNAQNTGDLLLNTGKVFIQKSQQGGSSPVLRGFEASRILLVIDGVKMNNAIYRSGHLQNIINTDQNSLSRIEILYGPSSTIYGSDALGGIVHLITKGPILSTDEKLFNTGSAFTRYSSANNEQTIHADASIGNKKLAWFQGYNFSDFGDMKMGNNYNSKYPDFGRRSNYIGLVNGIDSVMKNSDDRVQKFSGFKQWDIIQKLLFKPNKKISHLLNFQLSNSTNVPRYDRLQDVKNFGGAIGKTLRYSDWYYGPQKRMLGSYVFNATNTLFFDEVKINLNYQDIEESRQTREYRRRDRFDSRKENVKVFGANINGRKKTLFHEFVFGLDAQFNIVKSTATRTNLNTGAISKLDSRYPDGKNTMNNFGIYAQHIYKLKNKKWILNDGIRLQAIKLKSNITDNSFFNLPDTAVTQQNFAATGNIGIIFLPRESTNIKASISSAFRAPNIDDLSKIFESSSTAKQVVFPNANLKPEYTYNLDLTVMQRISKKLSIEITGFYTLFRNAILKSPFKINGQDSILYDGVNSQVLASQNISEADLYGFSADINGQLTNHINFYATCSFTNGRFKTNPSVASSIYEKQADGKYALVSKKVSSKPLDHIPPYFGKAGITYENKLFTADFYSLYNGNKQLDKYNADGEDNAQYATADGMPGWITFNIKGNINVKKYLQLQVGVENILDKNYRYFSSGYSASGRNIFVALRANW